MHRVIIRSVTHNSSRLRNRGFRRPVDGPRGLLAIALHVIHISKWRALTNVRGRSGLRIHSKSLIWIQILGLLLVSTCHYTNSIALSWLLLFAVICNCCNINNWVLGFWIFIIVSPWQSWLSPKRYSLIQSTSSKLIPFFGLDIRSFWWRILINLVIRIIYWASHVLMMILWSHLLHRVSLSLILHHLSSAKIITLVTHISNELLFTVVAS